MAHEQNYNRIGAAAMFDHYERMPEKRGNVRPNIDATRTHLNYNLHQIGDPCKAVADALERTQQATGRKPRKDAVVICATGLLQRRRS